MMYKVVCRSTTSSIIFCRMNIFQLYLFLLEASSYYLNLSSIKYLIMAIITLQNTLLGTSMALILRFAPKMFRITTLQAFSVVVCHVLDNNV